MSYLATAASDCTCKIVCADAGVHVWCRGSQEQVPGASNKATSGNSTPACVVITPEGSRGILTQSSLSCTDTPVLMQVCMHDAGAAISRSRG